MPLLSPGQSGEGEEAESGILPARWAKEVRVGKKLSTGLPTNTPAPPYAPTPRERASIERVLARRARMPPAARMKVKQSKGELPEILPDHPDRRIAQAVLLDAIGSGDYDFFECLVRQLVNVGSKGQQIDERELNFLLSVVKGVEPKDQIESLLAAQMAAVHTATMTFARRLAHVENIPQQDSAQRALNSLSRTFAAQVDTLKRYRTGPQEKLTVEQVTVNEGGQAIVGYVAVNQAKANDNGC